MIDITQLLLIIVIVVITSMLTVVGTQLFIVLRELKKTITKANRMLDEKGWVAAEKMLDSAPHFFKGSKKR
ncbi:hypothetical protein HY310_01335 [Candidatus Microgenomates bacterium]|nr:hypothetical protein [Candidatus Microgenomates bacterium]